MACIFTADAVLSLFSPNCIPLSTNQDNSRDLLWSVYGRICIVHSEHEEADPHLEHYNPWEWNFLGFSSEQWYDMSGKSNLWGIPHWSIIIPLTLLSAFLLSKQPQPKSEKVRSAEIPN